MNIKDRQNLLKLVDQQISQSEIGRQLEKNQSSISRELRRVGMNRTTYSLAEAQVDRNNKPSLKGRKQKLLKGSELLKFVHRKIIKRHWSPEQISGYLKKDKQLRQISYESIYLYIYALEDTEERRAWIQALRRRKKKRYSRKGKVEKRGKIPGRVSIHKRSKHIEEREEGGHCTMIMGEEKNRTISHLMKAAEIVGIKKSKALGVSKSSQGMIQRALNDALKNLKSF